MLGFWAFRSLSGPCAAARGLMSVNYRAHKLPTVCGLSVRMAENSPVYSHGCKCLHLVAEGVAGKPGCRTFGRNSYFRYSSQGCSGTTLYGYARISVREPEDKNLDLQVEQERTRLS